MRNRVLPVLGILGAGGLAIWFILGRSKTAEAKSGKVDFSGSGAKAGSKGGLGGAVKGGVGGAAIGSEVAPGIGTVVGGAIGVVSSIFSKHYPKSIDLNQEPGLTVWRYYRYTAGMADFDSTVLAWEDFKQPMSPADQRTLAAAKEKFAATGLARATAIL